MPTKVKKPIKKPIKKTKSKKKKVCPIINSKALKIAILTVSLIILLPIISFVLYSKVSDWLGEQRLENDNKFNTIVEGSS